MDMKRKFNLSNEIILILSLIFLIIIFSFITDKFFSFGIFLAMVRNNLSIFIAAFAFTILILGGDVDLSVGANAGLTSVIVGIALNYGINIWYSLLLGLSVGLLFGLINGSLSVYMNINPLIVTLGTLTIGQGFSLILTNGLTVPIKGGKILDFLTNGKIWLINFPFIILLIFFSVFYFFKTFTKTAQKVKLIGTNRRAAELIGINVKKIRLVNYVICGICASFSGLMISSLTKTGMYQNGLGMEMVVITAVFLGGASLYGGEGSIIGTFIGVSIITVLYFGLSLLNVSYHMTQVVKGFMMLSVVAAYESRERKKYNN